MRTLGKLRKMTNKTINKAIHAALGKCWHEPQSVRTGWGWFTNLNYCSNCPQPILAENPDYCSSLDLLWPLVEQICEKGDWFELKTLYINGDKYWAGFTRKSTPGWGGRPDISEFADTAPMAVALACLAIEEKP